MLLCGRGFGREKGPTRCSSRGELISQAGGFCVLRGGLPLSFAPGQGGSHRGLSTWNRRGALTPLLTLTPATRTALILICISSTGGSRSRGRSQVQGHLSGEGGCRSECSSEAETSSLQKLIKDVPLCQSSQQLDPEWAVAGPPVKYALPTSWAALPLPERKTESDGGGGGELGLHLSLSPWRRE